MKELIKDKSNFSVALLAAIFAVFVFKTELSNIYLPLGIITINALTAIIVFVCLLSFTAYLYALDYIRYGSRFENSLIFRWIIPVANFLYVVTILFPLFIIILWLINSSIKYLIIPILNIRVQHGAILLYVVNLIAGAVLPIVTFIISVKFSKNITQENYKKLSLYLKAQEISQLQKTTELFKQGFYTASIIEIFKVIESALRSELIKKGYRTEFLSAKVLIALAVKNEIINENFRRQVEMVRELRNKAAHLDISLTKKEASFALEVAQALLKHLQEINDN